ncbi:hypothetical protein PENSUB_10199 [Penicillium subrubescens]|uniref:Uncharacterized protein n=2 Tax=Penicillium subrubescens TaxID=1316194 RepID=A0A1Q5TAX7_9EURO|nr:hypothetical protein PENSUB_10199 [Penicillium subrubescens]
MEVSDDEHLESENDSSQQGSSKSADSGDALHESSNNLEVQDLASKSNQTSETDITKICRVIEAISNQLRGVEVGMQALQNKQAKLETNMDQGLAAGQDAEMSDTSDASFKPDEEIEQSEGEG